MSWLFGSKSTQSTNPNQEIPNQQNPGYGIGQTQTPQNSYGSTQSDLKWFRTCIGNSIASKIEYFKTQSKFNRNSETPDQRQSRIASRDASIKQTLIDVYNMNNNDITNISASSGFISAARSGFDMKKSILACVSTKNSIDLRTKRYHQDESIAQMKKVLLEFINMPTYENIRGLNQFGKSAFLGVTSHVSAMGTAYGSYKSYQNRRNPNMNNAGQGQLYSGGKKTRKAGMKKVKGKKRTPKNK
jgi:hypothetical protein